MKTFLFLGLALFLFQHEARSQSDCSTYYPLREGVSLQYTNYNKKGKTEGISTYKVTSVEKENEVTTATMAIELKDKKGKEIYRTDYEVACTGSIVSIDYESLIPKQLLTQYKEMDMSISGTDIEIPNDLSVGKQLEDANVAVQISMGGVAMNMSIDIVNRKVEKEEHISTPAGNFDCLVIYSENKSKMMMANTTFPSRVWLAEGVGMIKQETYTKNGTVVNSSMLTAFTK